MMVILMSIYEFPYLSKIFEAAAHKGVWTTVGCHFYSILNKTQQLNC